MINRAIIQEKTLKAIFKHIRTLSNGKQIEMMFKFNYMAGMRCINFCYLQVKDVLDENNNVRDIIELTPDKNKGAKKAKYYISDDLKKDIKEYLADFNKENRNRFLFTSQKTGKPYNRNSISRIFTSIYKTFNLDCSTHFGRRNFITTLLTNGIDITTVKTLVNHKNIQTTSIYYNENEVMLKNVVNSFSM